MTLRISALLTLLLCTATETLAQGFRGDPYGRQNQQRNVLHARYRGWKAALDADVRSDEAGISGNDVGTDDTLDVDEDYIHEIAISGTSLGFGGMRFALWKGELEGSGTPSSSFVWSGDTFAAGTPVSSKFEVTGHSALWDFPLLSRTVGAADLNLEAQVGYKYYSIVSELSNNTVQGGGSVRAPCLVVGARTVSALTSWLTLDAEATLNVYDLNKDVETDSLDYTIELLTNPLNRFYIGVGYKRVTLDIDDERRGSASSRSLDGKLDGFLLSLSYDF